MIEPSLALAFAVHANPGVYALLIGSGVSRAAGMPTGWDVIQDLSGRLAVLKGDDAGEDATASYQRKYGVRPEYGTSLSAGMLDGSPDRFRKAAATVATELQKGYWW